MRKTWLALIALVLLTFALPPAAAAQTCANVVSGGDAIVLIDCPDPTETTKICVGEKMCKGIHYEYPKDGDCPAGSSIVVIGGVRAACAAAEDVTPDPDPCPAGCNDGGVTVSRSRADNCCTVTKTRICSPPA